MKYLWLLIIGLNIALFTPVHTIAQAESNDELCNPVLICSQLQEKPLDCLRQHHSDLGRTCAQTKLQREWAFSPLLQMVPFIFALIVIVVGFVKWKPRSGWLFGLAAGAIIGLGILGFEAMIGELSPLVGRSIRHLAYPARGLLLFASPPVSWLSFSAAFVICNAMAYSLAIGIYKRTDSHRSVIALLVVLILIAMSMLDVMIGMELSS